MSYRTVADQITSHLDLESAPVALAFVDAAPPEIPTFEGEVPSSCTLWRRAEAGIFYAPAATHFNCPVGALTMGFALPDAVQQQLGGFVEKMCQCDYLGADEPAGLPSVGKPKVGIVYGPLRDFPLEPDLALIWLRPSQAMLANEAAGSAAWTSSPLPVLGRPACAALPTALDREQATMSLGCMGMRTFTEVDDDRLLSVIPASRLSAFEQSLAKTHAANAKMQSFYQGHKASFAT